MESESSRVADAIPELVWTAHSDGRVLFVNRHWCEYTGTGLKAARADGWLAAIHPDDLPALRECWRTLLASCVPLDMRVRVRRVDGAWRRFALRIRPLPADEQQPPGWCGAFADIEDYLPDPAASLDAMASHFSEIADVLPASVLLTTPEGEIEYVNRQAVAFRGASIEQQRGWRTAQIVHPDELPAVIAQWAHCVETGDLFEMEYRVRRADGVYRWFHVRGQPVRNPAGNIVRWCFLDVDIDDRKQGEALLANTLTELAASKDRLRAIIDAVPGFVWQAAPDGRVEFLNQRWCDYTGMSLEESLGIGWTSCIHPDDAGPLGTYWQALLEAGQPGSFEARLRRLDGSYRWFLIRAVPLLDDAGKVVSWYGQNTDIEDRKQSELLLAGEKHLLGLMAGGSPLVQILDSLCGLVQSTIEGALCSVALVDPRCTRPSCEVVHSLRLQPGAAREVPAELVEETDGRALDADSSPAAHCALHGQAVLCGDLARETRWGAWRAAARSRGFQAHWSIPIAGNGGRVAGIISVLFRQPWVPGPAHHNLMAQFSHLASIAIERARSEAALRQSEAFVAKAQRLSQTGTFSWRVATDEMAWSEEVYRILDLDPMVTPTLALIRSRIHPEDVPAHDDMIRRQRSAPADFEHGYRLLLPDGKVKWVHLVAHAARDPDGAVEYIAALQDITQRHHSEETLGRVRSELAHVARVASLGVLTASIAHEVNQPLAGIITNSSTCLRMLGVDPPNVEGARETVRRTIRDGNRASDVIKRLRALFAKKDVATERLDLNEAAREVVAMLLGELQRKSIILHPAFADHLPPVQGDRVQLQQVILNLLLNASDATVDISDRPRHVRITTSREGADRVRLAVSDNGVGFDPQDAERLFHAFYTTKSTGMGVGLSVSRSIIESHGGTLWADANEDNGATFAFSLPHVAAEPAVSGAMRGGTEASLDNVVENS